MFFGGDDEIRSLAINVVAKLTNINDIKGLKGKGFSLREIELITNLSKSKLHRDLKE